MAGLAFGIAFIVLIGQYIYFENSYNRDLPNIDNIYRLADGTSKDYNLDYRIKDRILESVPGVKDVCLLNHFGIDALCGKQIFQFEAYADS